MVDREGVGSGVPWATALDPVANMRALADVQVRSARAAGELIERLIARVDGEAVTTEADGADGGGPRPVIASLAGVDQVVELWAQLAKGLLQSITQLGGLVATGAAPAPTLDVATAGPGATVTLRAGERVAVWLHNSTEADVADIRLHSTELRDHAGCAIPAGALTFQPATIECLPARSSREVTVSATLSADESNGRPGSAYRGAILATGLPAAWLPVELVLPGP